jgi:ArsR family transcriptional regulator
MVQRSLLECCRPLARPALTRRQTVELERLFRTLGDRHRVQIVNILAGADDAVCVCDLIATLGLSQPTVSYHLKRLVQAGLLEREQRGRHGHYRLAPGVLDQLSLLVRGDNVPGEDRAAPAATGRFSRSAARPVASSSPAALPTR